MKAIVSKSPVDLPLKSALWRQKRELDICPQFTGTDSSAMVAKRNPNATTRPSLLLLKAILVALSDNILGVTCDTGLRRVVVESRSLTYHNVKHKVGMDWGDGIIYNVLGSTYHCGIVAIAEALARPREAVDFCLAWADLIELAKSNGALGNLSKVLALAPRIKQQLIQVADELYFWLAYETGGPGDPDSRIGNMEIAKETPPWTLTFDLRPLWWDADTIRELAQGYTSTASGSSTTPATKSRKQRKTTATTPTPPIPTPPPTPTPTTPEARPEPQPEEQSAATGFVGWQLACLRQAIRNGDTVLMFGPTASGKTLCFNTVIQELGLPYESVDGKEGLLDLDFFGSVTKTPEGIKWVDGPIARAMRRAAEQKVVVWIDEFTRIPQHQVNILIGLMNTVPEALMLQNGVKLWGKSSIGLYRRVEVPQCEDVFNCPAENLVIVAACNLGRHYAVHQIDPAVLRRFTRRIEFRYLDPTNETRMVMGKTGADLRLARACVAVANKIREMAETAEVNAPLDPASLIAWVNGIRAVQDEHTSPRDLIRVAQEEAKTTWMLGVLTADLNGLLPAGKVAGLCDTIADIFNIHYGNGKG